MEEAPSWLAQQKVRIQDQERNHRLLSDFGHLSAGAREWHIFSASMEASDFLAAFTVKKSGGLAF